MTDYDASIVLTFALPRGLKKPTKRLCEQVADDIQKISAVAHSWSANGSSYRAGVCILNMRAYQAEKFPLGMRRCSTNPSTGDARYGHADPQLPPYNMVEITFTIDQNILTNTLSAFEKWALELGRATTPFIEDVTHYSASLTLKAILASNLI